MGEPALPSQAMSQSLAEPGIAGVQLMEESVLLVSQELACDADTAMQQSTTTSSNPSANSGMPPTLLHGRCCF